MIWLAILTAYCFACALWSLSERRERDELRQIGRRLANITSRRKRP